MMCNEIFWVGLGWVTKIGPMSMSAAHRGTRSLWSSVVHVPFRRTD